MRSGLPSRSGESVRACLFSDILPSGDFGERWSFLTDRRLLVLEPEGSGERASAILDLPLERITEAKVLSYVGSSALVVRDAERGYQVARFSLGSHHEALDLSYYLNAIVEARADGKSVRDVAPPATRRSTGPSSSS